jgi:NADPH:quinone reductase-like Zn-dependent oxidoreductase
MRNVVVCTSAYGAELSGNPEFQTIQMHDLPVTCGVLCTPEKHSQETPSGYTLVRVKAFSCSYRDKERILRVPLASRDSGYCVVGSDFCGEVIETGDRGGKIKPGDMVILDPIPKSLSLNGASREYQLVPTSQLLKVPHQIPYEQLAGFAIPAKTAYCLIRAADLPNQGNVLVTAGRSAVSLAILSALRHTDLNVHVLTTSRSHDKRFLELGARAVLHASADKDIARMNCEEALDQAGCIGGFDAVLDPFLAVYLPSLARVLKPHRVYASCGLGEIFTGESPLVSLLAHDFRRQPSLSATFNNFIVDNITLRLRTFGTSQDLNDALRDHENGLFFVTLDQVFEGNAVGLFLTRTFESQERLGRVIYRYN